MAKVRTEQFEVITPKEKIKFSLDLLVNTDGIFYFNDKQLPQELKSNSYKGSKVQLEKASEFRPLIESIIKKYHQSFTDSKETQKSIVFHFNLQGSRNLKDSEQFFLKSINEESLSDLKLLNAQLGELGFSMTWEIKTILLNKSTDHLFYSVNKNGQVSEHKKFTDNRVKIKVIKWTEERENWFRKTEESLKNLILNIHQMNLSDENVFESLIDKSPSTGLIGFSQKK